MKNKNPKWGVFDTVDKVWLGDTQGPKVFQNTLTLKGGWMSGYALAKIAAQLADVRLQQRPGRCRAKKFPSKQPWRLRDTVKPVMTNLKALEKMERGAV